MLLLDEATNSLDTASEQAVQDALAAACVGRTVLVIAHRLATVTAADEIVVLNRGLVAEVRAGAQVEIVPGIYEHAFTAVPSHRGVPMQSCLPGRGQPTRGRSPTARWHAGKSSGVVSGTPRWPTMAYCPRPRTSTSVFVS